MPEFYDAFISYGRVDSKAFAAMLCDRLNALGYRIWFDFNDIPLGVDFQNQINDGIEKAHNFIFIIAPHAINSAYCAREVELALKQGKRIIPLLHVEQIDRDTWQQRNPEGTDEQWQDYQAKGLHSSFPNMHPEIGKINWVYGREGQDEFERSLLGLVEIFERHRSYVAQHTQLLERALTWERNQKQTRYLLIQQERIQAEHWLTIRFQDVQPPCTPTDLHCEFITESKKNAHNLMTQVFLAHAEKDAAMMVKIRRSLLRQGITVWTSDTDIRSGDDFRQSIERGIEQADNLVYLLSPDAQTSEYCQHELDYALSLHKRIIPILVRPVADTLIPPALKDVQYIDLTGNEQTHDYQLDESQLLKTLKEDAAYFEEHKIFLTQALRWERQRRTPSMLLRGYNLRQAEAWWKVAQSRASHTPTALQTEFLQESQRQPPAQSLDVFISYSRVDSDFARQLNDALQIQGKLTWFDQESIASGTDFQQEIHRGIETSGHFLFILSPESVRSPYCADEAEYARRLNKRIVTVLHRPINADELHPVLAAVQWLDFRHYEGDFNANFKDLLRTLDTDRDHLETHTKLLVRAIEWHHKDYNPDLLLRGSQLDAIVAWMTTNADKEPGLTLEQREYIAASSKAERDRQDAEIQRQRTEIERQKKARKTITFALISASVGFVIATVSGLAAVQQRQVAEEREINTQIVAQSLKVESLFNSGLHIDALEEAIRGYQTIQLSSQPIRADQQVRMIGSLQQVLDGMVEQNRLDGHRGSVWSISISNDGTMIASAGDDGTIKLWNLDGEEINTLQGHSKRIRSVRFSPDGKTLASASEDQTIKLWTVEGEELNTLEGHNGTVTSVRFSPDGQMLASASVDSTIKLWNVLDGADINTLTGHGSAVHSVSFSPDSQTLASASSDGRVKLWNVLDGADINTLTGHGAWVASVSFSPDGQTLVSASGNGTIKLWNLNGDELNTFEGHRTWVTSVSFSPDGRTLASTSADSTVKRWDLNGQELDTFEGHSGIVKSVGISPDGSTLISAGYDGIKLWNLRSEGSQTFQGHQDTVNSIRFSPDGTTLASASDDGTVKLWSINGKELHTLTNHRASVASLSFSPDGQTLASASDDGTVRLWNMNGEEVITLEGHSGKVTGISISSNGQRLASSSEDGTVKLWNSDGVELRTLEGYHGKIWSIRFSADGATLAAASEEGTIKLWSVAGDELATLEGHSGRVRSVSFSTDGQLLASASDDGTVKLWRLAREEYRTLEGHSGRVTSVSFSPDGQILASASYDNTIKLWNLNGDELKTLTGHSAAVSSIQFSPDGTMLASASNDGTIKVWNLNGDDLLQQSCNWLNRYLITHPPILRELTACHTPERLQAASPHFVQEAIQTASKGKTYLAERQFTTALTWDPTIDLDPTTPEIEHDPAQMALKFTAPYHRQEGQRLANQLKLEAAIHAYEQALTLDPSLDLDPQTETIEQDTAEVIRRFAALGQRQRGQQQAQQLKVEAAIQSYEQALEFNPTLDLNPDTEGVEQDAGAIARQFAAPSKLAEGQRQVRNGEVQAAIQSYQAAQDLDPNITMSSQDWDQLCWFGSLYRQADAVLFACENSVALDPDAESTLDSRGIIQAMNENTDGAIANFQAYMEFVQVEDRKTQVQAWIKAIEGGENPFTTEVLQES